MHFPNSHYSHCEFQNQQSPINQKPKFSHNQIIKIKIWSNPTIKKKKPKTKKSQIKNK